jgi:hypothetical protein
VVKPSSGTPLLLLRQQVYEVPRIVLSAYDVVPGAHVEKWVQTQENDIRKDFITKSAV